MTFFITTDYILKNYKGYIEPNIDADSLTSFIGVAQDVRLQTVLGYDLYNKYLSDIQTYGSPTGSQYIYLMDNYIQRSTAIWTLYEALDSLDTKVTNKGVVNKNSDFSSTADNQRILRKLNNLSNTAQFYDTRIREYITNVPSAFPEYFTQTGVNRIKPKTSNYFAGMWLPDLYYGSGNGVNIQAQNNCCNGNPYWLNR